MASSAAVSQLGHVVWASEDLVSLGCCTKLEQIWWLKTIHISSLTAVEVRSLKSV